MPSANGTPSVQDWVRTKWPLHPTGEDAQDHEPHWGRRRVEPPHWGRRRTMTIVTVVHIVGLRKQTCVFEKLVFKAPFRKHFSFFWLPATAFMAVPPSAPGWIYVLSYPFLRY